MASDQESREVAWVRKQMFRSEFKSFTDGGCDLKDRRVGVLGHHSHQKSAGGKTFGRRNLLRLESNQRRFGTLLKIIYHNLGRRGLNRGPSDVRFSQVQSRRPLDHCAHPSLCSTHSLPEFYSITQFPSFFFQFTKWVVSLVLIHFLHRGLDSILF